MLTAISHELRTPLAGILGASVTLECAGGRMSEEATAELLRGLSSSARKLDRLLTNLLDLEQLGWGTIPLNRQPFDIAALLEQVASRWRKETPWPQVCASSTTVWLDRDKVERIVEELLAKIARHTPQDTPVWIRADRQGTGLRLAVEDAGPGMPSEMRTSVFERYRHGETAPTYARPGYWPVARAPPCPAARWHRLGRGSTRRWLIVPGHLARPSSLTLANRPCRAPQGPSDGRTEAQNLAPLRSRSERLEVSQTSA